VTCDGRLFHRRSAATGNALSSTVDRRVYVKRPETSMRQTITDIIEQYTASNHYVYHETQRQASETTRQRNNVQNKQQLVTDFQS